MFKTIIEWFKRIFGIKTQDKPEVELSSDFSDVDRISVSAIMTNTLSSLTLTNSSANVYGDNMRAKYMQKFADKLFNTRLNAITQVCIGTGDCIAKPSTDGEHFGVDIIENKNFRIISSMGDFLYSVIIKCDEMKINNSNYERWEYHKLNNNESGKYVTIEQICFKDGKRVPLSECQGWENIKENNIIPNVDRLLFGRFKCPTLNRNDVNSPNGVPITFGADEVVKEVKDSWRRFNREFGDKEAMIFADKTLFKVDRVRKRTADGEIVTEKRERLPQGKERIIQPINTGANIDGNKLIDEYSPTIRDASLERGIEVNKEVLELICGQSKGILSKSDKIYTNSDEIKKSTQATFAFITSLRKVLESGLNDLLYSVDKLCNANNVTPMGDWKIDYDWSDSYVESMTDRFNQLSHGEMVGAVGKDEFRSWLMSEPLEQSKKWVEENKEEVPTAKAGEEE